MATPNKAAAVAELTDAFRSSNAAVLTEYRGLTVAQLKTLRRSLGENAQYAVVKNTLTKIAANKAGINTLDDLFDGPTAVAFITGDPVESAKGLRDFAKDNPNLVIKGGVLDGKALPPTRSRSLRTSSPARFAQQAGGRFQGQAVSGCLALPGAAVEVRPHRGSASRSSRPSRAVPSNRLPPAEAASSGQVAAGRGRPPDMYLRHQPN